MTTKVRFAALLIAAPAAGVLVTVAIGGELTDALPALVLLTLVWALFLVQIFSGRSARLLIAYSRLRWGFLGQLRLRRDRPRTIVRPKRSAGATRLAWSHDGWAHADGHLAGLDRLAERFDVTAFGCPERTRGEPPVTLELLPAIPHDDGITLRGLTQRLAGFDVVWTGGSFDGTTFQALDARAVGGPAVVCYDVENIVANYGGPGHPIRERAVREVDHFCASSEGARALLELDGVEPERISVVPMVVDMPPYTADERARLRAEGRRRWEFASDDFVALFIGRAVWEKGLHTLAGAAATMPRLDSGGRVRWLVAGDGDYLSTFNAVVAHYSVQEMCAHAGVVEGRDRHMAYATADVLVIPSLPTPRWMEQFGRVIPEAFHFGLPAVGTASGAIPEVIGPAGAVVAPGDHVALAQAVYDISRPDEYRRVSQLALDRAGAKFAVEAWAELVIEAIELALARGRQVRV